MPDERIFRFEYGRGNPEYATRTGAQNKFNKAKWSKGCALRVYATDYNATTGWVDVTAEFRERYEAVYGDGAASRRLRDYYQ